MQTHELDQAVLTLQQGGLIAYPTEAVFGLGCLPSNGAAIERLLQLKTRAADKGLIIIAASFEQLSPWIAPLKPVQREKIQAPQPRATTWLVSAAADINPLLTGQHSTLAVRITHHPLAAQLCKRCDSAIVSTSANRSGQAPARHANELDPALLQQLDFVLHAACGGEARPSRIIDLENDTVIRD